MEIRNIPKAFLIFLLFVDLSVSFYQHIHFPLDGDMASIILYKEGYSKVFEDPFGITVITKNSFHSAPNRFFAHWNMSSYFKSAPFFFQYFTDPINSVYLACGFAKIAIQILIIFLMAFYISGKTNPFDKDVLLIAVLVSPLFQAYGFNGPMGIIDKSVTYTFFYALPLGLLMIFFLPFFKEYYFGKKIELSFLKGFILSLFVITLSLNGPLIPGVVLIVCPMYLCVQWYIHFNQIQEHSVLKKAYLAIRKIPQPVLFYFILFSTLCLYSLFIGEHNSENFTHLIPLGERYTRLPLGIYNMFTVKLGLPLLLIFILVNIYFIKKTNDPSEGKKIITLLKWIALFALLYALLLPLGGYREYRPNIIRRDTFMPVILAMVLIFGLSTFYIFKNISIVNKKIYLICLALFLLIFTIADKPMIKDNYCEKIALEKIARSTEKIILIETDCSVMWWGKMDNPDYSKTNAKLMKFWNITKEEKLYYQK